MPDRDSSRISEAMNFVQDKTEPQKELRRELFSILDNEPEKIWEDEWNKELENIDLEMSVLEYLAHWPNPQSG